MCGSSMEQQSEVRYAQYLEDHHGQLLNEAWTQYGVAVANNPFTAYGDLDYDVAFFGTGYALASFPSLYDMYGSVLPVQKGGIYERTGKIKKKTSLHW